MFWGNETRRRPTPARKQCLRGRKTDKCRYSLSYQSRPFDLIRAWEIKDFFEVEPPHSPGQVCCEAFLRTADFPLVGEIFLNLLPIEFVNEAIEGSIAGRLVALLQRLKAVEITVASALQDELFEDMRKREPPLADWHHNDFLGGAGLRLHVAVYMCPIYNVAVYMCPIYNTAVPWFDLLDQRSCLAIRSRLLFHLNCRTCGQFDAWITCAAWRIGCYINSSKHSNGENHRSQRAESLKSDVWRKWKGCPKSQNCAVYYVHSWGYLWDSE